MTRTKEQLRKAVFGKLQSLRRKLLAGGVPCTYARSELSHENGDIGFTITCRLADDQATLLPQAIVRTVEGTQTFDHLTFDQGIARLKELFQAQHAGNGKADSIGSQVSSDHQDRDSNSNTEDGNGCVVDHHNQTRFSHEGDAN